MNINNQNLYLAWNTQTEKMSQPFNPFTDNSAWFSDKEEDAVFVNDLGDGGYELYQSTGVLDREGEPIFSGSFVSNNFNTEKEVIRVVEYREGQFVARLVKGKTFLPPEVPLKAEYNFAVVGHIKLNSELLVKESVK